jgi:hypothetical protein
MLSRLASLGTPNTSADDDEDPAEFHRRLAAMMAFKAVARELGLVFDVEFTIAHADVRWIRMKEPTGFPTGGEAAPVKHRRPATAVEFRGTPARPIVFRALRAKDAGSPPDHIALHGFGSLTATRLVDLEPQRTVVTEADPVSTAHHRRIGSGGVSGARPLRGDHVLVMNERIPRLLDTFSKRARTLAEAPDPGLNTLYADDLVRGMAIDICPAPTANQEYFWYSLCARTGTHHSKSVAAPSLKETGEEAPIEFGELAGATRLASEVAFRLDGWSLVCPPATKSLDEAQGTVLEDATPLSSTLGPPPGSLPRLPLWPPILLPRARHRSRRERHDCRTEGR